MDEHHGGHGEGETQSESFRDGAQVISQRSARGNSEGVNFSEKKKPPPVRTEQEPGTFAGKEGGDPGDCFGT